MLYHRCRINCLRNCPNQPEWHALWRWHRQCLLCEQWGLKASISKCFRETYKVSRSGKIHSLPTEILTFPTGVKYQVTMAPTQVGDLPPITHLPTFGGWQMPSLKRPGPLDIIARTILLTIMLVFPPAVRITTI